MAHGSQVLIKSYKYYMNIFGKATKLITSALKSYDGLRAKTPINKKAYGGNSYFGSSFPFFNSTEMDYQKVGPLDLCSSMFNSVFYTCVNKTSSAMVSIPFNLKGQDKTLNSDPVVLRRDHPYIFLLEHPNDKMDYNQFISFLELYLSCCGSVYIKMEMNKTLGTPDALWPLETFKVRKNYNEDQELISYTYTKGMSEVEYSPKEIIPIMCSMPDPMQPYEEGFSKAQAAWQEIQLGLKEIKMLNGILDNNAVPSVIIQSMSPISAPQAERMQKGLRQKFHEGGPYVSPSELKIDTLVPPQDPKQLEIYNIIRRVTCTAMGVPLGVLEPESESYASAHIAKKNFIDDTVVPDLNVILSALDHTLAPMFDERIYIDIDINSVVVDEEMQFRKWENATKSNCVTVNEYREKVLGLPPYEGPEGDQLIIQTRATNKDDENEPLEQKKNEQVKSYWEADPNVKGKMALVTSERQADSTHERRRLGEVKTKHCQPCVSIANLGWQNLGTLPPIGKQICGKNCKCYFEYKNDKRFTRGPREVDPLYRDVMNEMHNYKPKKSMDDYQEQATRLDLDCNC